MKEIEDLNIAIDNVIDKIKNIKESLNSENAYYHAEDDDFISQVKIILSLSMNKIEVLHREIMIYAHYLENKRIKNGHNNI